MRRRILKPAAPAASGGPATPGTRIGLALGAGAARGWSHIGVVKTLVAAGIVPEIIAGTSIGAVVGGAYAAGKLEELEAFARSVTRRSMLGLVDLSFAGSGLVAGSRLRRMLDAGLGDMTFEELPIRFAAVATEFGTGREIWLRRGHLVTGLRASYAIPGVFEPIEINGRWLLDGAMVNPVPVTTARALGADYVIAVSVNAGRRGRGSTVTEQTVPRPARAEPMRESGGNAGLLRPVREVAGMITRQIGGRSHAPPGIAAIMVDAVNITQDRISRARLAGDPPDLMIGPRLEEIGLFDFHRAEEAIAIGTTAAERALPDIRDSLAQQIAT